MDPADLPARVAFRHDLRPGGGAAGAKGRPAACPVPGQAPAAAEPPAAPVQAVNLDAMRWAMQVQHVKLGASSKVLLLLLAGHAGKDGRCWPSVARLAKQGCMSERAARVALHVLAAAGLVQVQTEGRAGRSRIYTLAVPASPAGTVTGGEPRQVVPRSDAPTPAESAGVELQPRQNLPGSDPSAPTADARTPADSAPEQEDSKIIKGSAVGSSAAPPLAPHPSPTKPPTKPDRRGTLLPDDWTLDEAGRAYAVKLKLDPDAVAERFRLHWHTTDKNPRKRNWRQAWQLWCLRQVEFDAQRKAKPDRHSDEAVLRAAGLMPDATFLQPALGLVQ